MGALFAFEGRHDGVPAGMTIAGWAGLQNAVGRGEAARGGSNDSKGAGRGRGAGALVGGSLEQRGQTRPTCASWHPPSQNYSL